MLEKEAHRGSGVGRWGDGEVGEYDSLCLGGQEACIVCTVALLIWQRNAFANAVLARRSVFWGGVGDGVKNVEDS